MVAAGYTMYVPYTSPLAKSIPILTIEFVRYGSSANLVLTTGNGVNGYTLDAALGEFILTHPDIKIPSRGKIYSFNEGNSLYYHEPTMNYLNSIKYPSKESGKSPYSARYIGSMVADVHRTLLYGGIFGYPDDKKSKSGKLRLLYEAFPMAFLTEQVRFLAVLKWHSCEIRADILVYWCGVVCGALVGGRSRDDGHDADSRDSAKTNPRALLRLPRQ